MTQPDYERGGVKLYRGDCLAILPELEAGSVDMVWTDPPYGHSNAEGDFLSHRDKIMVDGLATALIPIANDDSEAMRAIVNGALLECARLLRHDSCCCCCCCCCGGCGPSPTFAWLAQRMDRDGLQFFHTVIWDKRNPGIGWRYRRQHEMIMVAHKRGGKLRWADESVKSSNIISLSKPRNDYHPNEKPVELVLRFLLLHSVRADLILDPFLGSGTTAVACVKTGRRCIGIELDPKYFDIACERVDAAFEETALLDRAAAEQLQLQEEAGQ